MIHVIFVIGRIFVCVEMSNKMWLAFLSNNWFCHLTLYQFVEEVLRITLVYVSSVKV